MNAMDDEVSRHSKLQPQLARAVLPKQAAISDIERSEAPAMAAAVACPARRECPAYLAASRPARCASFFTTRATAAKGTAKPAKKR